MPLPEYMETMHAEYIPDVGAAVERKRKIPLYQCYHPRRTALRQMTRNQAMMETPKKQIEDLRVAAAVV